MEELTDSQLESELEGHVEEQRASLIAIDEALTFDPGNEELLQVKEELIASVKEAEESLLHLKRARLLREVDALSQVRGVENAQISSGHSSAIQLASRPDPVTDDDVLIDTGEISPFQLGSRCRFRHTDGCWYNGKVIAVEDPAVFRVAFLNPTNDKMQICRFYLQQRCRFGGNCRLSHGMEVSYKGLQPFIPPDWRKISNGSTVLACDLEDGSGLWRPAELESWDEVHYRGSVVFVSDGKKLEVGPDALALSEHPDMSDLICTSSDDDDEDEDEDEPETGISFLSRMNLIPKGQQTDTVTFANWEKHTRGMASKMMANMGYQEGMGLGISGQGQIAPIEARILPSKQSLGFRHETNSKGSQEEGDEANRTKQKKSRGGKRKRFKKWAAAAFAAKVEQDKAPDVFGFINQQLAGQHTLDFEAGAGKKLDTNKQESKGRKEDRRSLVANEDRMLELRSKISKLEEMARRNQKDKAVYDGVNRKIEEVRKALGEIEAGHAIAASAVHSKEKEKNWLRF